MTPRPGQGLGGSARRQAREATLRIIGSSGAGAAAASASEHLRRRVPRDEPASALFGAFTSRRLAIVAHYSHDGSLDPGFIQLGEGLSALGYGVLVATTGPASLDRLVDESRPFAFGAVVRGNEGFDFQSWRRGMELARGRGLDFDRLILTNGSMFGPLAPMEHVLSRMDKHGTWGMTESMDFRRHIQSWWLGFGRRSLTIPSSTGTGHASAQRPTSGARSWPMNFDGPTTWHSRARPYPTFGSRTMGATRNPLFFAWRELIRDWQMPFVKRSLFGPNYDRIDMTGWQAFLAEYCPSFDQSLIGA